MYSGEATVSIDILSEVLQGGEMLKIRGLWHNSRSDEPSACSTPQFMAAVSSQPVDCTTNSSRSSLVVPIPQPNGQLYDRRPERITNASNLPVLKERPLNLMSPSQKSIQPLAQHHLPHSSSALQHLSNTGQSVAHLPQNGHIVVKKEMSIDPGEMSSQNAAHFNSGSAQSHQIRTPASKKIHSHSDKRSKTIHENVCGATSVAINDHGMINQAMISSQRASSPARYSTASRPYDEDAHLPGNVSAADALRAQSTKVYVNLSVVDTINERDRTGNIQRLSTEENPRLNAAENLRPGIQNHLDPGEKTLPLPQYVPPPSQHSDGQVPEPLNFLTIKQEPTEWSDYDVDLVKTHIEVSVKPELVYGDQASDDEGEHIVVVFYTQNTYPQRIKRTYLPYFRIHSTYVLISR